MKLGAFYNNNNDRMLVFGYLKEKKDGFFIDVDGVRWSHFNEIDKSQAKEYVDLEF